MSGIVNLESAIRTCKVDTGYSSRIQSDRFLNPRNLVCPVWNGLDTAGRLACANSFRTKREGCNSAEDRVGVENSVHRPQYMTYISSQVAANQYNTNYQVPEGVKEGFYDDNAASVGIDMNSQVKQSCGSSSYEKYDRFSHSQGL